MVTARVDLERFDGTSGFALWRQRMKAILVQIQVHMALEGINKLPATLSHEEKEDVMELAYHTLILYLGDKVLREVSMEKTAVRVRLRLESLYMTNTLTNKIFLKGRLFCFKMGNEKSVDEYLDDFNKIVIDIENIQVKMEDEDLAIMVLNSLPPIFSNFVETMKYSKESLSMEEVTSAIKQRQMELKANGEVADGLVAHGRFQKKSFQRKAEKSKHGKKSQPQKGQVDQRKLKCFYCHKEGHFRKDCPERKRNFMPKNHD